MDFDPVTDFPWITENGLRNPGCDEINIVTAGFNSRWDKFTGPIAKSNATMEDLIIFKGAYYSDPVFSWHHCVGVTDIKFFNSDKLGDKYKDNIFMADVNHGNLYCFTVNESRSGLALEGNLSDLVADNDHKTSLIAIGTGFAAITDIETGPDGYLYLLTYLDGKIYKISPVQKRSSRIYDKSLSPIHRIFDTVSPGSDAACLAFPSEVSFTYSMATDYTKVLLVTTIAVVIAISLGYFLLMHRKSVPVSLYLPFRLGSFSSTSVFSITICCHTTFMAGQSGEGVSTEMHELLLSFLSVFYYAIFDFGASLQLIPSAFSDIIRTHQIPFFTQLRRIILPATFPFMISAISTTINSA